MFVLTTSAGMALHISDNEIPMYGMLADMASGNVIEKGDMYIPLGIWYPDHCYQTVVGLTRHYVETAPNESQDARDARYSRLFDPFDEFEMKVYNGMHDKAHICMLHDAAKYMDNKACMKFAARAYLMLVIGIRAAMAASSL